MVIPRFGRPSRRSLSVLVVLCGPVDRAQPRLATLGPELVGRDQRGRGLREDPQLDFRFPVIGREQSRSAARTEMLATEAGRCAGAFEAIGRPYAIEGEGGAAFSPAVGAVADAHAKRGTADR